MGLLFTIKLASNRSQWRRGAQVSHSGELLLRDYGDGETKVAPPAVRHQLSPDKGEAAGPAGLDGGSAPWRAPRPAPPGHWGQSASDFPAPPQIAGYSSPTVPTLRPPSWHVCVWVCVCVCVCVSHAHKA